MSNLKTDENARKAAIDPSRSFIVQAPAGSGKTELLTQRFLKLLCHVKHAPEEIIAITFTRKAAAEMRQRVLEALNKASNKVTPLSPHEQHTAQLAKKALEKDTAQGWQLQNNPNRLRILTIDALAGYLVKQMPITADISAKLNIAENPLPYYEEAVDALLLSLQENPPWKASLIKLLLHLDNRAALVEHLLTIILSKREQWLPHLMGHQHRPQSLKKQLNTALQNIVIDTLQTAKAHVNDAILSELIPLADFAGRYCSAHQQNSHITRCKNLTTLDSTLEALPVWQGVAELLLTQKGEWRKRITKRQGFPAKGETAHETAILKVTKQQMTSLLDTLQDHDALRAALQAVALCPPTQYNAHQWAIIEALIELLPVLAAQLTVIFNRENITDFIELNLAALRALGEPDHPTDLALHLDYRINHLLIDEFQDTSVMQYTLIERLIAGWQANEGRSIFIVGDPMQSIYRFRHAEVGLFIRAQQQGIANMPLHSLTLMRNFRSSRPIVDWINQTFATLFPTRTDMSLGAAPYSPAIAAKNTTDSQIEWQLSLNDDGTEEAEKTALLIQQIQKNHPQESIAILVRSRSHLTHIVDRLHAEKINFQAVDLEPLATTADVLEIHTVTRALLHRMDNIAWLALLRAPYCGLSLSDLHTIAQKASKTSIYRLLKAHSEGSETLSSLSDDAQLRLNHRFPAIYHAIENAGRSTLHHRLTQLWQALDAHQTLQRPSQHNHIEAYLTLIDNLENQHATLSLALIEQGLGKLYAKSPADAQTRLQIMTIHKAKGLEFDHVILPGLHRKTPHDAHLLLKWLERPNQYGQNDLILSPIKATDQDNDPIYQYLVRMDNAKSSLETIRLLYVAITRAKRSLYLLGNAWQEDHTLKQPPSSSFLSLLWGQAQPHFSDTPPKNIVSEETITQPLLKRFTRAYFTSKPIESIDRVNQSHPIALPAIDNNAAIMGIVIHQLLEQIANHQWKINIDAHRIAIQLTQHGMLIEAIPTHTQIILHTIASVKEDPRAQWILSPHHQDAHNEYSLSIVVNHVQ